MRALKLSRLLAEKTQKQLGKEIGASQALVSLMETGKINPGEDLKAAIAKALDKSEGELFPEENNT